MIDLLTDILEASRTRGVVFARVRFRAPWGLRCDAAPLVGFHIAAKGSCSILLHGSSEPHPLEEGDVAIVTRGEGHDLFDSPESAVTPLPDLLDSLKPGTIGRLQIGNAGPETVLICGGYLFQSPGPHPLVGTLPPVLHIQAEDQTDGMRAVLGQLIEEVDSPAPGATTVINRLVDALLVHVLRVWTRKEDAIQTGWLAGARDPSISRALRRIHRDYSSPLPLASLAQEASMSLSTFKRRFGQMLGVSPGVFVTRWRLEVAARLLRDTDLTVAKIARDVGYRSEYAFNRSFRREKGNSPGRYRDEARNSSPSSPVEQLT